MQIHGIMMLSRHQECKGEETLKPTEDKTKFISLRAEGKSYTYISKELGISKSTCTAWEQELKEQIADLKGEQLNELYDSYYMTKEARIKKLGNTLERINTALDKVDLSTIAPEKLLDFKLKYSEALKEEYTGQSEPFNLSDKLDPKEIVTALEDLLNRVRAGDITAEQANRESTVLANLLKAFESVELKAKLDALEAVIGTRG